MFCRHTFCSWPFVHSHHHVTCGVGVEETHNKPYDNAFLTCISCFSAVFYIQGTALYLPESMSQCASLDMLIPIELYWPSKSDCFIWRIDRQRSTIDLKVLTLSKTYITLNLTRCFADIIFVTNLFFVSHIPFVHSHHHVTYGVGVEETHNIPYDNAFQTCTSCFFLSV